MDLTERGDLARAQHECQLILREDKVAFSIIGKCE